MTIRLFSKRIEPALHMSSKSVGNTFYCLSDDLVLSYLPGMKRKGAYEWAGPCPSCGGEDRFIWRTDGRQRGFCRQCGWTGDFIQLLIDVAGLTFPEAHRVLGGTERNRGTNSHHVRRVTGTKQECPAPVPVTLPSDEWCSSAASFLAECQRDLETSPEALLAITGRHLTPYTAVQCGIGWNPADRYVSRRAWGLADVTDRDGKTHSKLLLPKGLVIATQQEGKIISMAVRCPDDRPSGRDKYHQVRGAANLPYVAGSAGLPVVLVESALDAALAWQESFCTVAAVAVMGNRKAVDLGTHAFIEAAPVVLATPDNDTGGGTAWKLWRSMFPRAALCPAIGAKDLGEMHKAALSWPINEDVPTLGEWLQAALEHVGQVARAAA